MPSTMQVWRVSDDGLRQLDSANVAFEKQLEDWIEADISLIGLDGLIVGRQVRTDHGGFIDLLAINDQGQLVIVELKRARTPREVVAQCLDYGSWVHGLSMDRVVSIFESFKGTSLETAYSNHFETALPEDIDPDYQIVIVAESLDDASERIVKHLSDVHQVNINAVFFNVFEMDGTRLLGRSWLSDPDEVEERAAQGKKRKWTGYLFVNTGITPDNEREWSFCEKYQFVSAGGGTRWMNAIRKLKPGDNIFAYIKGKGYVGFGTVKEEAVPVQEFHHSGQKLVDLLPENVSWRTQVEPDQGEWLARVDWHKTFSEDHAKWFPGAFANQNVVCKIRDANTAKYLEDEFDVARNQKG